MNRLIKALLKYYIVVSALIFFCGQFFMSCKEKTRPTEKVMVQAPEKMDEKVEELNEDGFADSLLLGILAAWIGRGFISAGAPVLFDFKVRFKIGIT